MAKVRFRPRIWPSFPPVIISDAITSMYIVIATWIPDTVVSRSSATAAMETFMTELSSAIRNWPDARVTRTTPDRLCGLRALDGHSAHPRDVVAAPLSHGFLHVRRARHQHNAVRDPSPHPIRMNRRATSLGRRRP